jgi:hypothetical protein
MILADFREEMRGFISNPILTLAFRPKTQGKKHQKIDQNFLIKHPLITHLEALATP